MVVNEWQNRPKTTFSTIEHGKEWKKQLENEILLGLKTFSSCSWQQYSPHWKG